MVHVSTTDQRADILIMVVDCSVFHTHLASLMSDMGHEFLTVQIRSAICTYDEVPHDARVELLVACVCVEGVN
jgi:hypothetical protein